jgi:hypothetical protein
VIVRVKKEDVERFNEIGIEFEDLEKDIEKLVKLIEPVIP